MKDNLFDLTGKVAVVTGGAGHLGSALSEILAAYGATVVIASRDGAKCKNLANKLNIEYGGNHWWGILDILDSDSVNYFFSSVIERFKKIDILINNASTGVASQLENYTEEDWLKGIDGNINAYYRCIRAALPHMLDAQTGNIINIASMYGMVSPNPEIYGDSGQNNPANYGASKAAIIQLSKYIACHYGSKGIRCNSISPGPFPKEVVQQNQEFIKKLSEKTALGRIGKPEELKGVLLLLASDASSFITGQNIAVDGGWTAW